MGDRFPSETMPFVYDSEVVQREIEDIHRQLGQVEDMSAESVQDLIGRMSEMQEELSENSDFRREANAGNQGVLPEIEETSLQVTKFTLLPLVNTWYQEPMEVIKYPHVGGFQFFASPERDFVPIIDISGQTVDLEGVAATSHATNMIASASQSPVPSLTLAYKDLPFWDDMDLVGKSIINVTQQTSGTITSWNANIPLTLGTDISWTEDDQYRILNVKRPKNLIGQGPLPFAFKIISAAFNRNNPGWDGKSYFVQCRTYSRGLPKTRRYGKFTQAGSLPMEAGLPAADITASPFYYLNHIFVKWSPNWSYVGEGFHNLDYWKLYRTEANDTALCDDDTYVIDEGAGGILGGRYRDHGYDAVTHPNGPQPDTTYYYWVRAIDKDGNNGVLGGPDNALLGIASDPVITSVTEEATRGFGFTKDYVVEWTCPGGAEGYKIKWRRKLNGSYGLYTMPIIVNHTTEFGQDGGEDIQKFTIRALWVNRTYTVAIQAIQNWQILGLNSSWVTQDFTVGDSASPGPPT